MIYKLKNTDNKLGILIIEQGPVDNMDNWNNCI